MLDKIIIGSYTTLQKAIFVNKTCGVEIFDVGASNIQPDYYKRDEEIAESREEKILEAISFDRKISNYIKNKKLSKYDAYLYAAKVIDNEANKKLITTTPAKIRSVVYKKLYIQADFEECNRNIFNLKFITKVDLLGNESIDYMKKRYIHYLYLEDLLTEKETCKIVLEKHRIDIIDALIGLKVINDNYSISKWKVFNPISKFIKLTKRCILPLAYENSNDSKSAS